VEVLSANNGCGSSIFTACTKKTYVGDCIETDTKSTSVSFLMFVYMQFVGGCFAVARDRKMCSGFISSGRYQSTTIW